MARGASCYGGSPAEGAAAMASVTLVLEIKAVALVELVAIVVVLAIAPDTLAVPALAQVLPVARRSATHKTGSTITTRTHKYT